MATLTMGQPRTLRSHVIGSTGFFMNVVNPIVAGTVTALITRAAGGGIILVAVLGGVGALAYLAVMVNLGRRRFAAQRFTPPSPTVVRASKKKSSSSS
jgi:predicted lipid-binding transport protein (Tim44 family)